MAGSDTFRITNEQTVMPSWLVASIRVACSMAHSVVFAALLPASALGSICDRRAEMTANSAPTKKPFTTRSTASQMMPGRYSLMGQLPGEGVDNAVVRALRRFAGRGRREAQPLHVRTGHALHTQHAAVDLHLVAQLGQPVQPVGDVAGHGVVFAVGHLNAGPVQQLVRAERGVERHGPAHPDHAGT